MTQPPQQPYHDPYGNQGQPQYGQGQPQYGQGQPQYGQGQPQYGQSQPQYGQSQPQYGQGQPQYGQSQPQHGQGQPQYGQSQPQYGQGQSYNDPYGNQPAHGNPYGPPAGQGMSGAPVGYQNPDDKTWALIAHFGGVVGPVPALIAFLVKGKLSPTVRAHSLAALNFQIVVAAAWIILVVVSGCGGFFLPSILSYLLSLAATGAWIVGVVFAIIAGMKANQGQLYRYPLQIQLIK
jgi:uncharacterized Tic20 family protein